MTFFISLLLIFPSVFAAETIQKASPGQQWHCLQNTYCADANAGCKPGVGGHRVKLTTKSTDLPARNQPTGVFVCVGTQEGNVCTSGDGTFDQQMLGYNGLAKLQQSVKYEFQGLFRSSNGAKVLPKDIVSNNQGKLSIITGQAMNFEFPPVAYAAAKAPRYELVEPLEMQDYTPASLPRKWLALNLVQPVQVVMGQGGEQQGTFTFEGALAGCKAISWDPYGIVFDSQSLEPVAGIKITLTKKRANGVFTIARGEDTPSILNPVTTIEDGAFEFFVPDGTYRLNVIASGFTFPSTVKLNPNYAKIYSELYRGEDIIEKGGIQHRDVPIDSKTTPYHSNVKLIAYFPLLDKGTNTMIIQGRVTHPLTKINIYGKKPAIDKPNTFVRTKLLTTLAADKKGQFDIRYNMNKLGPTEVVGDIEFIKPDYTIMKDDQTSRNTTLKTEPILNYLEGYAYNQAGKPIPDATVGVYLNLSNKPAYETKADANGFYRISSEYLPSMSYGVRYTGAGGTNSLTTSQFIAQNTKYLETQGSNLFVFRDKKGKTFTQGEREKFATEETPSNLTAPQEESKPIVQSKKAASDVLPIVIILVLLGLAGVAVVVYFMKKNKSP